MTTGSVTSSDHLAMSVQRHQLNEETAFFRTIFGLVPGAPEEFSEPHGRLRSLSLRPRDGDLRIVLNVTESSREDPQPQGVSQVAFGCADVAAAVAGLRANGIALMAVPDNYYVDLAARFDLPTARLAELRDHQLLYDGVGDGELLHAYTDVLATGFYVEVLERRGGYDGYGSANTFVRLAAQAQR
jgi:4-hydroxyphenylpyruvate dioxygenase